MFKLSSETELLDSFRPIDREEIRLPEHLGFPAFVPDYLAWIEPSGHRAYVVFKAFADRPPLGIVFRRDQGGGSVASMCEWCQSMKGDSNVSLLTARASSKRVVGLHLCNDLSCREKFEGPRARIVQRMSEFALRNLF